MKLFFLVAFSLPLSALAIGDWSNGCGPCIGENCETGYLTQFAKSSINHYGLNLCKDQSKIFRASDWLNAIKNRQVDFTVDDANIAKFTEVKTPEDYLSMTSRLGAKYPEKVQEEIREFYKKSSLNPIVLLANHKDFTVILFGTSDGKSLSYFTDWYRRKE